MKENDRIGNRTEYLLARLPIGKVSQEIESLLHVVAKIYTHWLLFNLALVLSFILTSMIRKECLYPPGAT